MRAGKSPRQDYGESLPPPPPVHFNSPRLLVFFVFAQIRVLEGNIQKAETEICRLDGLVEKIRLVSSLTSTFGLSRVATVREKSGENKIFQVLERSGKILEVCKSQ